MSMPGSPTTGETFDELRDWLYRRLLQSVKQNVDHKRFFPCTTGEDILKEPELKKIFGHVLSASPQIPLPTDLLAKRIIDRRLQTFLAALIYATNNIKA